MPDAGTTRGPKLIGPAAFQFLWEKFFSPLAALMAPGVAAAVEEFAPDVVVSDQHAVAGALVAERGHPVRDLGDDLGRTDRPLSSMPKVEAWLQGS